MTPPDSGSLMREPGPAAGAPGKLKIFFGYAAGAGKTYAMLEAARRAQNLGADVVAGYIEPHARPETLALLQELEQLPTRPASSKDAGLREFDLDAALARHPQLLLVDELAHTNAGGCRHVKRYQDVEELLRAGINVYTTVNVQQLESLHDIVSSISGISVSERLPDRVFDEADQVKLVDIEPDELLERLREGKIRRSSQPQQAMERFFTRKNLTALRGIALRRMADQLNRLTTREGTPTGEHVLACISGASVCARVIRTAARMAEAFHGSFTALFVEPSDFQNWDDEARKRLRANLHLAEQLGARIVTAYGDDAAMQIAEYARASGVSRIVLGRGGGWLPWRKRSLVERLSQLAPEVDIHFIPGDAPPGLSETRRRVPGGFSWLDAGKTVLCLLLSSAAGWAFYLFGYSDANVITVYILGVLCVSVWTGRRIYGIVASLFTVLVFNFLFTEPRFTFLAYDAGYPLTFLVMLAASLLTSSLTLRVKSQALQAARKAYRTQVLLETSQRLQQAESGEAILEATAEQLQKLLDRAIVFYPVGPDETLGAPRVFCREAAKEALLTPEEKEVAAWVLKNNLRAGATTETHPGACGLYLAVRGDRKALAVAGIAMEEGKPEPDAFEQNLLAAILDECGMTLEKTRLDQQRRAMEETARQEALRANLLRAISHDLRTPLTSIAGNAGILMKNCAVVTADKRQELYTAIYDDAMWLTDLVENLLAVTRIENGAMSIHLEEELLDDVFQEALSHLDRRVSEHPLAVRLSDELLMARMDARLIIQVIINIVNNAVKYTPAGCGITLSAEARGDMVRVRIADEGPGIPDDAKEHVFDMFYTADNVRGDGRRGMGMGLALCRSIIVAHGGAITVEDNVPRGAAFCFTLHSAEVTEVE